MVKQNNSISGFHRGRNYFGRLYGRITNRKKPVQPPMAMHPGLVNSFSQYGEDLVLDALVGCKPLGFYIDIGANHPVLFNNTKRFYDKGWMGINIEPNPILFGKLCDERSRDQNLNFGVGSVHQELPFYVVSADTLSGFDKSDAERNCKTFGEEIIGIKKIQMVTLTEIFEQYAKDVPIDFVSIDVEGYEMSLLKGNDWTLYRPLFVLIEIVHNFHEIFTFFESFNYKLVYKNDTNGIFFDATRSSS